MPFLRDKPLLTAALLVAAIQCVELAIDSQILLYYDSTAFLKNALGLAFFDFRSYVYTDLIRAVAVPLHSLRVMVLLQTAMGGLAAWLLAFALMRYFRVRAWIAILAALVFAIDPVQVFYDHMLMTETAAGLAAAAYLVTALEYLRGRSPVWLIVLAALGILLVSLRTVYVPVVLTAAVVVPVLAWFKTSARAASLWTALALSCAATMVLHIGYRHLTGRIAGAPPAYHHMAGRFLMASVSPILQPEDAGDARIAEMVAQQAGSAIPFGRRFRNAQLWNPEGLAAKITGLYPGDEQMADQAAKQLADAAIRRDPLGFLWLGVRTYFGYWSGLRWLRGRLKWEGGMSPDTIDDFTSAAVSRTFHVDLSHQYEWSTFSRRYELTMRLWYVFLLAAPFLAVLALRRRWNRKGAALLLVWICLLTIAACFGGTDNTYRYLHPFSLIGLAACAILAEGNYGPEGSYRA